jgi:hypothetical protein
MWKPCEPERPRAADHDPARPPARAAGQTAATETSEHSPAGEPESKKEQRIKQGNEAGVFMTTGVKYRLVLIQGISGGAFAA